MREDEGVVARLFAASTDAPAQARRWAGSVVPGRVREAVVLAVSELVTNALVHGELADGEAIEVGVLGQREDGRVRVRVAARGVVFAAVPAAVAGAGGGWGLRVVEMIARSWGVEQDGARTVVWFEV